MTEFDALTCPIAKYEQTVPAYHPGILLILDIHKTDSELGVKVC